MSYASYVSLVSYVSLASRYSLKAMDWQPMRILSYFIRPTLQVGNDVKIDTRPGA
jgi:hypothetical protein